MVNVHMFLLASMPAVIATMDAPAKAAPSVTEDLPAFCAVSEMGYIPEVDSWEVCRPGEFKEATVSASSDWRRLAPWATQQVTPVLARSLSRWARPQMEKYGQISPLGKVEFKPVNCFKPHGKVVLQATLDELPSHLPLVHRWLRLYLLYDVQGKSIIRVTVTIRGERLE